MILLDAMEGNSGTRNGERATLVRRAGSSKHAATERVADEGVRADLGLPYKNGDLYWGVEKRTAIVVDAGA